MDGTAEPPVIELGLDVDPDLATLRPCDPAVLNSNVRHESLMRAALDEARKALAAGEVPIGAVIAVESEIIATGFNQPIGRNDPTAHAEIVAMRGAAARLGNYRLGGAVVYVTVEPCLMCVGAMVHARIATLVYGAVEPRTGAVVSTIRGFETPGLNHRVEVASGVLEDECRALMQSFFKVRR
jgi:tRNA(adenine34) deaminase